jgi:hypothetical protein
MSAIESQSQELHAELERLRAENAALKSASKDHALTLKVSDKGALSVYGLMKFPVTLYKDQWLQLLASSSRIEDFIREHEDRLVAKGSR